MSIKLQLRDELKNAKASFEAQEREIFEKARMRLAEIDSEFVSLHKEREELLQLLGLSDESSSHLSQEEYLQNLKPLCIQLVKRWSRGGGASLDEIQEEFGQIYPNLDTKHLPAALQQLSADYPYSPIKVEDGVYHYAPQEMIHSEERAKDQEFIEQFLMLEEQAVTFKRWNETLQEGFKEVIYGLSEHLYFADIYSMNKPKGTSIRVGAKPPYKSKALADSTFLGIELQQKGFKLVLWEDKLKSHSGLADKAVLIASLDKFGFKRSRTDGVRTWKMSSKSQPGFKLSEFVLEFELLCDFMPDVVTDMGCGMTPGDYKVAEILSKYT